MAVHGASRRDVEEEMEDGEDDDDDDDEGFDEEFMKQMDALKQACQMHAESRPGGEVRLKSSTLGTKFGEEEEEEDDQEDDDDDDDDALLLSIERRFLRRDVAFPKPLVTLPAGVARHYPCVADDVRKEKEKQPVQRGGSANHGIHVGAAVQGDASSDDDEDLLRSIRQSCGALDLIKACKNAKTVTPDARREVETVPDDVDVEYPDACGIEAEAEEPRLAKADDRIELQGFLPSQHVDDGDDYGYGDGASGEPEVEVPEHVLAVTDALRKNRLCQQTLRDVLRQVEIKLQENKDMQRRVNSLIEFQKACKRKFSGFTEVANPSVELIATKTSRAKKTGEFKVKGPPHNVDVETFRKLQCQLPTEFNVKKWTKKEIDSLGKGVRQQLQQIRLRVVMEGWASDDEERDFNEQLRHIGEEEEELKKGLPFVDWKEVARIYVSGRIPSDCKLQWENNENPSANFGAWTKAEDKKLLAIAQAHDMADWAAIAEELGTRRTPAQCVIRFQRSLNATIVRSAWTPEEDEQLQAAVEKFGEKDWQSVAACMEGRLGSQCMARWTKVLHPDRHRRGRWQKEEDTRLKWAVSVYGPKGWKNIATHVPGRSDVQCRERWCNVLDPSVNIDDWTPDEDTKLEDLVVKYGRHRWAAVAAELGRTDNQCFRHWKLLHPKHRMSFKKDMAIRRAAFASNFVGREKERPDLGLQDFLPPEVGEKYNTEKPSKQPLLKSRSRVTAPSKARSAKRKGNAPGNDMPNGQSSEEDDSDIGLDTVSDIDLDIASDIGIESNTLESPQRHQASTQVRRAGKKRKAAQHDLVLYNDEGEEVERAEAPVAQIPTKQNSKSAPAAKRKKINPPVGEILRTEGAEAAVALKPTKQKTKLVASGNRRRKAPLVTEIHRLEEIYGAEAAAAPVCKKWKTKSAPVAEGHREIPPISDNQGVEETDGAQAPVLLEEIEGAQAAVAPVHKKLKTKSAPVAKRRQGVLPTSDLQRVEGTDGAEAPLLLGLISQKTRSVPASKRRRKKPPLSDIIQRVEEVEGAEALVALEPTVQEKLNASYANRKRKSPPISDIQTMEEVVEGAEAPAVLEPIIQKTKSTPVYKRRRKNPPVSNILRMEEVQGAEALVLLEPTVQRSEPASVERQRKDPPVSDTQRREEIERAVDPVLLEPSLPNSDLVPVAQGHGENAPLSDILRAEDRVPDTGGNSSIPNSQQELKVYRRREKKIENARDLVSTLLDPLQDEQGERVDGADAPAAIDIITMEVPKPVLRRHRKKLQLPDFVYDKED